MEGRWQETKTLTLTKNGKPEKYTQPELETDRWAGLIPTSENILKQANNLDALKNKLSEFESQVQWISGIRVRPPRVATYGGGAPTTLSSDGSDIVDHLIAAKLRSSADPMLKVTGKFFSSLGEQLDLDNPMVGAWRSFAPSNKCTASTRESL